MKYRMWFAAIAMLMAQQGMCLTFGDALKALQQQAGSQSEQRAVPIQADPPSPQQVQAAQAVGSESVPATPTAPVLMPDAQLQQNGMWKDPASGLTWSLCPLGTRWQGRGRQCDRYSVEEYPAFDGAWWNAAVAVQKSTYGGYSDWRLPTIRELNDIHQFCPPVSPQGRAVAPSYFEIPVGAAAVKIRKVCPDPQDFPSLDPAIFVSFFEAGRSTSPPPFWSTTSAPGSFMGRPKRWVFDVRCTVTGKTLENSRCAPHAWPSRDGYVVHDAAQVLAVRGGSYDEFNDTLSAANAEVAKNIDPVQERAAAQDQVMQQRQVDVQAADKASQEGAVRREQGYVEFRKHIKAGDSVSMMVDVTVRQGLVLAVKGDLVHVQVTDTDQQIWFKRSKLYPVK